MKICTNCKYHSLVHDNLIKRNVDTCSFEGSISPVDGKPIPKICALARAGVGHCGPEGIHFVEKEAAA